MAISQSQKPQTIKTTNPQSSRLAGFVDVTLEDASAWNTVDGVKQDRGWAYADGSTLVNTSGKYDSYLARTGSLVLPSGPFRTELMDLSSYITHSESWDSYSAEGYFSSDLSGQWFLEVQVKGSGNDDRVIANSSLTFTNIFVQTSPSNESVGAAAGQTSSRSIPVQAYISSSSSIVFRAGPNGVADTARYFSVFGKIKLSGKPTIPSFDTFLLDYPVVQLYDSVASGALGLPEATESVSGIVSTGTQTFAGDKTFTGNIDADSYTGLPVADGSTAGVVSTGSQTISGDKTFTGIIAPNGGWSTTGGGAASDSASGLVTTGTQTFAGDKTFTGDISANTISANGTIGASNLNNGSWSPGLYSITNCSVTSSSNKFYQRVGNMVTCWLLVTVAVTTPGLVEFDFSLPVGSVSSYTKINGTGYRTSNTADQGVVRLGSTVSRGRFNITSTASGSRSFNIVFSYYLT